MGEPEWAVVEAFDRRSGRRLVFAAPVSSVPLHPRADQLSATFRAAHPAFMRSLAAHPRTFEWSVVEGNLTEETVAEHVKHRALGYGAYSPLGWTPLPDEATAEAFYASPSYATFTAQRLTARKNRTRAARRWEASLTNATA